ncbi:hypothetical protein Ahia01_000057100 [Argonauta hians]
MNWVGGSRRRMGLRTERKVQKEYFEKKRQNRKMNNFRRPSSKQGISQDLIAIQTLSSAYSGVLSDKVNERKPIRKVDLDKEKLHYKRFQDVKLPHSPIKTPSKISLEDATTWNISTRYMQTSKTMADSKLSTIDSRIKHIKDIRRNELSYPSNSETDYGQTSDSSITESYSNSPNTQSSNFAVVPSLCKNEQMEPLESSFKDQSMRYWENSEFQCTSEHSKHNLPFITNIHQIEMSRNSQYMEDSIKDNEYMDSCLSLPNEHENVNVSQIIMDSTTFQQMPHLLASQELLRKIKPLEIDKNLTPLDLNTLYVPKIKVEYKDTANSKFNLHNSLKPTTKAVSSSQLCDVFPDSQSLKEKTDKIETNSMIHCTPENISKSQGIQCIIPLSAQSINIHTQTDFQQILIDASTSPIVFAQTDQIIQCDITNPLTESSLNAEHLEAAL